VVIIAEYSQTCAARMEPNAIRVVSSEANCRKDDIEVIQVPTEKLPSGCQVFSVQILNECSGGSECNIGSIHLSCGSFHSELMINPRMHVPVSLQQYITALCL
jgi:hypothetical protein